MGCGAHDIRLNERDHENTDLQEVKYDWISVTKFDMTGDMKQRFNRVIVEERLHFASAVRFIELTHVVPVNFPCILIVLIEHAQPEF